MKKKKVIIIAYFYKEDMAAMRPNELVRFLPENGWEPTVITASPCNDNNTFFIKDRKPWITQIKDKRLFSGKKGLITNILRILNKLVIVIDDNQKWADDIKPKIEGIIKKEKTDLIFITCMPFSAISVGRYFKKKYGIPYVLEFRDGWTLNPYRLYLPGQGFIHRSAEKQALKEAECLITTTPTTSSMYAKKYPFLETHTILYGYKEGLFDNTQEVSKYDKFTITHAGTLDANRKPDMILEAIRDLVIEKKIGSDFQLNICGQIVSNDTKKLVKEFGITDYVKIKGFLPLEQSVIELKKSHASLLIQGDTGKKYLLPIAGKTFEYFAVGNPIICIAPKGDNENIIKEYTSHSITVNYNEISKLKDGIVKLYNLWKEGKELKEQINVEEFSSKFLTKKFAEIFDDKKNYKH